MENAEEHDGVEELLRHAGWLRKLAGSLVGDRGADDLVQEAYLAALRSPPDPSRPARPWLARVVRNAAQMRFRGDSRRAEREAVAVELLATPESPADHAERIEMQRLLCELVLALPEPHRATVVGIYFDGLKAAELARRDGLTAAAVRQRHKHALGLLRDMLDKRNGGHRRTWLVAFIPIANPSVGGVLAMKTTLKFAIALVLLLVGGIGIWHIKASSGASRADTDVVTEKTAKVVVPVRHRAPQSANDTRVSSEVPERGGDTKGPECDLDPKRVSWVRPYSGKFLQELSEQIWVAQAAWQGCVDAWMPEPRDGTLTVEYTLGRHTAHTASIDLEHSAPTLARMPQLLECVRQSPPSVSFDALEPETRTVTLRLELAFENQALASVTQSGLELMPHAAEQARRNEVLMRIDGLAASCGEDVGPSLSRLASEWHRQFSANDDPTLADQTSRLYRLLFMHAPGFARDSNSHYDYAELRWSMAERAAAQASDEPMGRALSWLQAASAMATSASNSSLSEDMRKEAQYGAALAWQNAVAGLPEHVDLAEFEDTAGGEDIYLPAIAEARTRALDEAEASGDPIEAPLGDPP